MLRKTSLALIGVLLLACYAVPYLVLDDVADWRGSFLFWTVAGVLVIFFNYMTTVGFGDQDQ